MHFLITGAAGFVGQYLCEDLLKAGHQVTALSRRGTDLAGARNVPFDLEQPGPFPIDATSVDAVIHLAARAHRINDDASNPLEEFRKINRDATVQLAEWAIRNGVKRFVYVSSIGVNGNATTTKPFSEQDDVHPVEPYALSKLEAERKLIELCAGSGMELTIVRPPLVYGPNAPGNFQRLTRLIEMGLPIPLGAIENRRSFIYVRNLVDVLALCATHPRAAGQTFVIGGEEVVSTAQFIRLIADAMHRRVWIAAIPETLLRLPLQLIGKAGVLDKLTCSLEVDGTKLRDMLGWKPRISMRDALRETFSAENKAS